MRGKPMVRALCLLVIAAALAGLWAGCRPPPPPPPPDTPFHRVAAQLDSGGDLLVVANLDGIVKRCVDTVADELATSAAANAEIQPAADLAARLNAFLDKNGFYAVRGYGFSMVPNNDGTSRVKSFLARDPAARELPLWQALAGGAPRELPALRFLPADTVMACAGSMDLNRLWELVESGIAELATPEVQASFQSAVKDLDTTAEIDLRRLIRSAGEGGFVSIQFDQASTVSLPLGKTPLTIPEPAFLIGLAVKDASVLEMLDQKLSGKGLPLLRTELGATTLRSLAIPLPLPIPLQPTFTMHAGYLLFGSTDKVVKDAVEAFEKGAGLSATPEFQKAFEGLPMTLNGLTYFTPRLCDAVSKIQEAAAVLSAGMGETEPGTAIGAAFMRSFYKLNKIPTYAYVTVNEEQGIRSLGTTSADAKTMVLQMAMMPVGMLSAIAIPSFVKARVTSQKNACINNLRQIEAAKDQYALEHGLTNGAPIPGADDTERFELIAGPQGYMKQLPICPASPNIGADARTAGLSAADYEINAVGQNARCRHKPDEHALR